MWREGYDHIAFLSVARHVVANFLRHNRGTRAKLVLRCNICNMERVNIVNESGTIVEHADFHSNVEITIGGVSVDELYDTVINKVMETMAAFQMESSK